MVSPTNSLTIINSIKYDKENAWDWIKRNSGQQQIPVDFDESEGRIDSQIQPYDRIDSQMQPSDSIDQQSSANHPTATKPRQMR